ncbi:uncharacterized protein DSM5745_04479 [Aspergillus mulundensis]|uniref:F-box domain-containing protein n=1 Tax=Aspergillus mulundensis TaxID=1810919 RepID=A0A3D8SCX0_9EURO|nr:hypothetical protein DSM5745_04479 [Aspergillus mulundensis]RDW84153.1 hypothetical protein DSM5745_04479 [Aspergillus mulundensis]
MKRRNKIKKVISRAARLLRQSAGYKHPSPDKEPQSPLLNLPFDVLHLILPHLPLESQACLALTCKPLHRALGFVLENKQFAWPRYLATEFPPGPYERERFGAARYPELPNPRNELLHLLEDRRWMYGCCDSLKLHPKQLVEPGSLQSTNSQRCISTEGVVDLCACLALTFSDKIKLIQWLKTGQAGPSLHRNVRGAFVFRERDKKRSLVHHCSVSSQPDAFVSLLTTATLDADDCLIVTTIYHVYWEQPRRILRSYSAFNNAFPYRLRPEYRPPHNAEPVFLCPHIHAVAWLYSSWMWTKDQCTNCDTRYQEIGRITSSNRLYLGMLGKRNRQSHIVTLNDHQKIGMLDINITI